MPTASPGASSAGRTLTLDSRRPWKGSPRSCAACAPKDFPTIRTEYVRKAQRFGAELPGYMASFKAVFPDFQPPDDIYVLHSLGEMDGGMRVIDYLGYLVAQEAGRQRDLRQLAAMTCAEAKTLVFSTVHTLRANAR